MEPTPRRHVTRKTTPPSYPISPTPQGLTRCNITGITSVEIVDEKGNLCSLPDALALFRVEVLPPCYSTLVRSIIQHTTQHHYRCHLLSFAVYYCLLLSLLVCRGSGKRNRKLPLLRVLLIVKPEAAAIGTRQQ